MTLAKAVAGTVDRDEEPEDFVSVRKRHALPGALRREYRLTAYNGSETTDREIEVGDLLPYSGDYRNSQWSPALTNLLEDGQSDGDA